MKKIFSFLIVSLLAISVLIFPAMAAVNANSVTWNAYPVWTDQFNVYGYVCIIDYTGNQPSAYITGETNKGESIYASVSGRGYATSSVRTCNKDNPPFLLWWDSSLTQ